MKNKKIRILILAFALLLPLLCMAAKSAELPPVPYIHIDSVPAIGGGSFAEGYIWFEGEAGDFGDYAITMALQVTRGGQTWGPKPASNTPLVDVNSLGYFSCLFVSGGDDINAQRLFVWLIPSNFVPDGDFARTDAAAFDKVVIERYANGDVDIQHTKEPSAPPPPPPGPDKVFPQQKHPHENNKLSLCYSPYTNGLSPEKNSTVPIEQMRWQLDLISRYADTIRLFGVSGELEKIYKPAKEEYKMRIIAGCWIGAGYTNGQIYAELDKLIELANAGYADIAVVGSEAILRGDVSANELISYIQYVRDRLKDKDIPVGTSDTPAAFLNNPNLVQNCDVILCTIYPFFSNVTADNALKNLAETYERVKNVSGGRQVIISESGWPTEGSPEGLAIPGMDNAKKFFEESYKWSREKDVEIVFFSEIDEAWKSEGQNGDIGGHWGHFTSAGILKDAYYPVYQSILEVIPTNPTEPTNPTNPTNPTEPTNPTNPTEPTNSTEPTNPTEPTNSTEPTNPTNPTNPTEPTNPTNPTNPTEPTNPTNPSDPLKGHVLGNATIGIGDAQLAFRAALKLVTLVGDQLYAADLNDNDTVEISEAMRIFRYALKLSNVL